MRQIRIVDYTDEALSTVPAIKVGPFNRRFPHLVAMAVVEEADVPILCISLYDNDDIFFFREEALIWPNYDVIGAGQQAAVLNLDNHSSTAIPMEGYFGYLYPTTDALLISSARHLHCFGTDGQLQWTSTLLGFDGVQVSSVEGGIITGFGNVDPPYDWKPFKLSLIDGLNIMT
jgi:hypothetical protein